MPFPFCYVLQHNGNSIVEPCTLLVVCYVAEYNEVFCLIFVREMKSVFRFYKFNWDKGLNYDITFNLQTFYNSIT